MKTISPDNAFGPTTKPSKHPPDQIHSASRACEIQKSIPRSLGLRFALANTLSAFRYGPNALSGIITMALPCIIILLSSTTLGSNDVDRLAHRAAQIHQQYLNQQLPPSPLIGDDLFSKELSGGQISPGEMLDVLDEFAQIDRTISVKDLPVNTKLTLQSISTYFKSLNNEVFISTDVEGLENSLVWYTNKLDSADEQKFSSFISAPRQINYDTKVIQTSNITSFLQETCRRIEVAEYILLAPKPCIQQFPFVNNAFNIEAILNDWIKDQSNEFNYNESITIRLFKNNENEFAFVITQINSESQTQIQTILTYLY